jgi:hypothetical protein
MFSRQKISVKGGIKPAKLWIKIICDRSVAWHLFHILSPHSLVIRLTSLAASFS